MFHAATTLKPQQPPAKLLGKLFGKIAHKTAASSTANPRGVLASYPGAPAAQEHLVPAQAAASSVPDAGGASAGPVLDSRDIASLYERHAPAIYAHCRRLLGSAPAGRDALQESFVRVLQHHRVLGPGDQALRYLYRTSTNVCINLLRQRSVRERAAPLIAAQINAAQSNQPVPGDREFVRMLLDQCDETAVAVALMHFIDGMTQVEVAATLGITRRTVYNRIRKIERLAAEMLQPCSALVDDGALERQAR
jgi:RNA polymerase sigma-70 factor (ECF subfamily)